VRWLAIFATASIVGCQRCSSGGAAATSSGADAAASAAPVASASAAAAGPGEAALPDIPEVRDTGRGAATAALRAVFQAYGIAFDAAALEAECKVDDEDGASIDDIEDVAFKHGLEAVQVILPPEHVLLDEAGVLPVIVIVTAPDETERFIVAWRRDGDRVLVMDPIDGKKWVSRADLEKSLYVHEMTMAANEWQEATAAPGFRDGLRARMVALGVTRPQAQALIEQASAEPGWRGASALDAAIRVLESDPSKASGDARAFLAATYDCAFAKKCAAGVEPVGDELWSALAAPKGPKGEPQVLVSGAVAIVISGKRAP
jgi:ATP-binding cassette subfamily B protein